MSVNNIFNTQRQYNFILRQFSVYQNKWTIAAAVIFSLLLLISFGKAILDPSDLYDILGSYKGIFFFGGLILTSQVFSELHSPHKSYALFTLPVSNLEKLTGSWLITSPIYIFVFWTISFIIYCSSFLIAGEPIAVNQFFSSGLGNSIATYMVIQTIFLWGACYFRKNNFMKTVLSLIGLFIMTGMFAGLLTFLMFNEDNVLVFNINSNDYANLDNTTKRLLEGTTQFLFWAVLGPYMLLMSYFTLKERQV